MDQFDPNELMRRVAAARLAAERFDPSELARRVAAARLAAERFDPSELARRVAAARLAAERFDPSELARRVAAARLAVERFDPSELARRVAETRLAAERFDPSELARRVAAARLAAERFDPSELARRVAAARLAAERFDPSELVRRVAAARLAASKLLAGTPRLTPELFGGAWNERVAEAVGRLERTEAVAEDIVADAADSTRAVEELTEDAATVQAAASPEALKRVNTRLFWLCVKRLGQLARLVHYFPVAVDVLCALLGADKPDWPTIQELMTLLGVTPPPDGPPVPAQQLPTTEELQPIDDHDPTSSPKR